ncbi:hypothetical protein EVC26_030 [Rhizobium phage RHph_I72]|nr:hypothetical protein EVC26_030 [Rhizobium phage RHph_I72]
MLPTLWNYDAHPYLTSGAIYLVLCLVCLSVLGRILKEDLE